MNLTAGLRKSASFRGARVAMISGEVCLTHGDMLDRVSRLASSFRKLGVTPGDRIAILAANGNHYVECYFAALWAGGVAVPVNPRGSLQIPPGAVSQIPPPARQDKVIVSLPLFHGQELQRPL